MKSTVFITAIVASAISVTGVAALAMGPGMMSGHHVSFEELDADSSGEITPDEMAAHRDARFSGADTDGDGVLSHAEMMAARQKRMAEWTQRMLDRFDADKDGGLSRDELPMSQGAGRMFDHIDSDGSGGISADEYAAVGEHKQGRMKHRLGKH